MVFSYFLIIQTLYSIAVQSTRPIVSLFADSQGVSVAVIGFLVSAYAFFPMLFAVKAGKWLDVYGARHMCLLGSMGMLLSLIIPIMVPVFASLFFSQLLMGFSQICCLVSLQKTVGNLPGNRDNLITIFSLTGSLGELIGPLASGFGYEYFGFRFTFAIAAVLVGLVFLSCLLVPKEFWKSAAASGMKKTSDKTSSWKMLEHVNLRKALIISGLVLYSKDLFVAYFPVLGTEVGMNASSIGIILSLVAGSSIGVRLIQFRLLHIFGRAQILTATLVISGLSFMSLNLSSWPVIFGLIAVFLGIGLGLGQPLSLTYAMNVSPLDKQGEVLGLRLTFNRFSQFVSPFFFGAVGRMAGVSAIFLVSGVVLLLGAWFTRMRQVEMEKVQSSMSGFPLYSSEEEDGLRKKTN
ncbi:MFS transporter [Fictibacillus terranigra]|uniref:MFS transporter n=1 Tax=Fictibacillus terranigra TaxID=3058424 RepID=A0ABT8EC54_9BACL|nr:MFS transporter [Fictibacillus sp. CENA-BCM004]MDN4075424.1 MFS transporter [Fictibacillus sp. CENA-BCM004]